MRTGKCIYRAMKCHYKHVIGIFLSALGKKKKEITFLISTFSMSSMIEILPAVRRVWPGMLVHVHLFVGSFDQGTRGVNYMQMNWL